MTDSKPSPDLDGTFQADARVTLFGFDATSARVHLLPRTRAWRVRGVIRIVLITLVVAPMVTVIPPHAPWLLGVLGGGTYLARRRWTWRYTLADMEATCPRCGAVLHASRGRLKEPHGLTCEACHNDPVLKVAEESLAAHAGETE